MLAKRLSPSHLPHLHQRVDQKDPFWPTTCHSNPCNYLDARTNASKRHSLTVPAMPHMPHMHMPHFHTPHNTTSTKIAVAGITGKLGRLIAKHLLSYDFIEVHGIARNPDKLPEELKSNPRLKLFYSNFKDVSSIRDAVKGCSILMSVILSDPASEVAMQKAMIDACIAEHVPRFMPNEFTLDWRCVDLNLLPQKKVNQEIFEYLEKNKNKVKGVHILIGAFMETMFSFGYWYDPSKSPAEGLSGWGTGDEIWEITSYNNAAMWATAVALDKDATGFYRFLGDRVSIKEIAKALQDRYNLTTPIPFTSKGSLDELRSLVQRGVTEDPNSEDFWKWKGPYALFLSNGQAYLETPIDNGKYIGQLFQQTLEDWLEDKEIEELSQTVSKL